MSEATITGAANHLQKAFGETAPGVGEAFVRAHTDGFYGEEVNVVSAVKSVATYATYRSLDVEGSVEAIVRVEDFLTDVDLVAGAKDVVTVTFEGEPLAETVQLEGQLTARARLPSSPHNKEKVPLGVVTLFEGARFKEADEATTITTTAESLNRLVSVVDERGSAGVYPVTVSDGAFTLESVSESEESHVWGSLDAEVDGGDVEASYGTAFADVVGTLRGDVTLHVLPDNRLVVITADSFLVTRHIVGPLA